MSRLRKWIRRLAWVGVWLLALQLLGCGTAVWIKVVDQHGTPLEGLKVGYVTQNMLHFPYSGVGYGSHESTTNSKGMALLSAFNNQIDGYAIDEDLIALGYRDKMPRHGFRGDTLLSLLSFGTLSAYPWWDPYVHLIWKVEEAEYRDVLVSKRRFIAQAGETCALQLFDPVKLDGLPNPSLVFLAIWSVGNNFGNKYEAADGIVWDPSDQVHFALRMKDDVYLARAPEAGYDYRGFSDLSLEAAPPAGLFLLKEQLIGENTAYFYDQASNRYGGITFEIRSLYGDKKPSEGWIAVDLHIWMSRKPGSRVLTQPPHTFLPLSISNERGGRRYEYGPNYGELNPQSKEFKTLLAKRQPGQCLMLEYPAEKHGKYDPY